MKHKNYNSPIDIVFFIVILMLGVTGYLWSRLQVVSLGYDHQQLVSMKKKALEENRQLKLKYADLASPARIERYSREKLGLVKPSEKQFRYIK